MANPYGGEVPLRVDGQLYDCKLTLGALMDLEQDLDAESLVDLVGRFEQQSFQAHDILRVIAAGLRAGGWNGTQSDLLTADIDGGPMAAARAAAQLLTLAFSVPD
ncbi:MAG: gene transfer agent family protein [Pseudomonadota bacterium]